MRAIRAIVIVFSTYSRIPMPQMMWTEEDSRQTFGFLPLVGCVIGAAFYLWSVLFHSFNPVFLTVGSVLIPLMITGGIHMDGFLDTCDALSSHQSKEKKLAILKDVHIGAFALIWGMMYLLMMLGLYAQAAPSLALPLACGFVLSRCFALHMLCLLPNARQDGMLYQLQQNIDKRAVRLSALLFGVCSFGLAVFSAPLPSMVALLVLVSSMYHFQTMAEKHFGGITGDLAGYCIQFAELSWAAGIAISGGILL